INRPHLAVTCMAVFWALLAKIVSNLQSSVEISQKGVFQNVLVHNAVFVSTTICKERYVEMLINYIKSKKIRPRHITALNINLNANYFRVLKAIKDFFCIRK